MMMVAEKKSLNQKQLSGLFREKKNAKWLSGKQAKADVFFTRPADMNDIPTILRENCPDLKGKKRVLVRFDVPEGATLNEVNTMAERLAGELGDKTALKWETEVVQGILATKAIMAVV